MVKPVNKEMSSEGQRMDGNSKFVLHKSIIKSEDTLHKHLSKKGKSLCPLCPKGKYKAAWRSKVKKHLSTHDHGIILDELDLIVHGCHLKCRKKKAKHAHYHCPCGKTLARKNLFLDHWKICSKRILKVLMGSESRQEECIDDKSTAGHTDRQGMQTADTTSAGKVDSKTPEAETSQPDSSHLSLMPRGQAMGANATHEQVHNLSMSLGRGLGHSEHLQPTQYNGQIQDHNISMLQDKTQRTTLPNQTSWKDGKSPHGGDKVEQGMAPEFMPNRGNKRVRNADLATSAGNWSSQKSDQKIHDYTDDAEMTKTLPKDRVFSNPSTDGCEKVDKLIGRLPLQLYSYLDNGAVKVDKSEFQQYMHPDLKYGIVENDITLSVKEVFDEPVQFEDDDDGQAYCSADMIGD